MFGQGAVSKNEAELNHAIECGDLLAGLTEGAEDAQNQARRLIAVFHKENKDPQFDWDTNYNPGFTVTDLCTVNATTDKSNTTSSAIE